MSKESAGLLSKTHPIQLTEVYLFESEVRRAPSEERFKDGPVLDLAVGLPEEWSDPAFSVRLSGEVHFSFREEAAIHIKADMLGEFLSPDDTQPEDRQTFGATQAPILLWPYLRAAVSELARMTGIGVPVLPTLDVVAATQALVDDMRDTPAAESA
jgi:preprotein translocase subunit SecB